MGLVKKGRNVTSLEATVSREGDGGPDTFVTATLAAGDAVTISSWFGESPPSQVSIVGYAETGVFMTGIVDGRAISAFASECFGQTAFETNVPLRPMAVSKGPVENLDPTACVVPLD